MRLGYFANLLIFCCTAFSQSNELSGYILAAGSPIHGAHVYDNSNNILTISNTEGKFLIPVDLGDSILISHVGYKSVDILVDSLLVSEVLYVSLQVDSIMLDEVQVLFPTYLSFKEQILATDPKDSSFQIYNFDKVDYSQVSFAQPPSTQDPNMENRGVVAGARFNLEGLTKSGKEKKKYRKLKEQEILVLKANHKVNREWVSEFTKLEGERLTDFIAFCNFSPDYIVETPIYIIREDMMELLKKYKSEEGKTDE